MAAAIYIYIYVCICISFKKLFLAHTLCGVICMFLKMFVWYPKSFLYLFNWCLLFYKLLTKSCRYKSSFSLAKLTLCVRCDVCTVSTSNLALVAAVVRAN